MCTHRQPPPAQLSVPDALATPHNTWEHRPPDTGPLGAAQRAARLTRGRSRAARAARGGEGGNEGGKGAGGEGDA